MRTEIHGVTPGESRLRRGLRAALAPSLILWGLLALLAKWVMAR